MASAPQAPQTPSGRPKAKVATAALPPIGGNLDRRQLLDRAMVAAMAGNTAAFFQLLARNSGLPGVRHNEAFLDEFVQAALVHGAKIDALLVQMASLDPDIARGDTEFEFVPLCAVHAMGARATADDKAYKKMLPLLNEMADDLRFRVRDGVVAALAKIGARRETLLADLAPWTFEHYFQAAAVIRLLAIPAFLETVKSADEAISRLDEAFALARDAPRSSVRYPGFKALMDALAVGPSVLSTRFTTPAFDLLERWAATTEPPMREIVEANLRAMPGSRRLGEDIARVRKAFLSSAPPLRDPTTYVGPTRKRGKHR